MSQSIDLTRPDLQAAASDEQHGLLEAQVKYLSERVVLLNAQIRVLKRLVPSEDDEAETTDETSRTD